MSRFNNLFNNLKEKQRVARIPFMMLGFPDGARSLRIIDGLIAGGADAIELGIPFSDPIADGPIIQQAANQARDQGITPMECFKMISKIRESYPQLPIGLLVYANIVNHFGNNSFYLLAYQAGVDAVLIPDIPIHESLPYCQAAKANHIHPVLIATHDCSDNELSQLASLSEGFTYVVTRAGVTGTDKEGEFENSKQVAKRLKQYHAPPCVFGFGIKSAKEVKNAYLHGAQGAIIGSALIEKLQPLSKAPIHHEQIVNLMQDLFVEKC